MFLQIPWLKLRKCLLLKRSRSSPVSSDHDPNWPRFDDLRDCGPSAGIADLEMKTKEEVADNLLPASSLELLHVSKASLVVLRESMYLVCFIYNMDFQNLVEEHKVEFGDSLLGAADLVLMDHPYNIWRVPEDQHSNHDRFSIASMKLMVSLCRKVMKPRSHDHMFSTALQLASWGKFLINEVEEQYDGSRLGLDPKMTSIEKIEALFDV